MWWLSALALTQPAVAAEWPDIGGSWAGGRFADEGDAALIIAIEEYAYLEPVLGARRTGDEWEAYFLEHRGIPSSRVISVTDRNAYRESILRQASEAASRAKPGGTLWVVFVGHGAPSKNPGDGMFVGSTANKTPDSLFDHSVRQSELATATAAHPGKTVMIVDACFSGLSRENPGESLAPGLQVALSNNLVAEDDTTVLTAGQSDEFSGPLPRMARPGFSYLLLGGLRGWADANGDGLVTTGEVAAYAREGLDLLPDRTQTPQIVGDRGLALARGSATGPDLRKLVRDPESKGGTGRVSEVYEVDPDIERTVLESTCRQQAVRGGQAAVEAKLDQLQAQLLAKQAKSWRKQAELGEACLVLPKGEQRQPCIDQLQRWIDTAEVASVEVESGVHVESTQCGKREYGYPATRRPVPVPELQQAGQLMSALEGKRAVVQQSATVSNTVDPRRTAPDPSGLGAFARIGGGSVRDSLLGTEELGLRLNVSALSVEGAATAYQLPFPTTSAGSFSHALAGRLGVGLRLQGRTSSDYGFYLFGRAYLGLGSVLASPLPEESRASRHYGLDFGTELAVQGHQVALLLRAGNDTIGPRQGLLQIGSGGLSVWSAVILIEYQLSLITR